MEDAIKITKTFSKYNNIRIKEKLANQYICSLFAGMGLFFIDPSSPLSSGVREGINRTQIRANSNLILNQDSATKVQRTT